MSRRMPEWIMFCIFLYYVQISSLSKSDHDLSQHFVADLESRLQDSHSLKKLHKCNVISIPHITKTSPLIRYAVCNIKCMLYFDALPRTWN